MSQALMSRMEELDLNDGKTLTLRNGVDLEQFWPLNDRQEIRRSLSLTGFVLLSVGHLIERKGHHIAIEALRQLEDGDEPAN